MEHIGDEYNKKACLGLGLNKPVIYGEKEPTIKDYRIRMSNTAHLWGACNRHARVFTSFGVCEDIFCLNPVAKTFPGLSYDVRKNIVWSSAPHLVVPVWNVTKFICFCPSVTHHSSQAESLLLHWIL